MNHLSIEEYSEGILIIDTSTLQIRNANTRAAELFRIDKEKISAFRLPELLPEATALIASGESESLVHELPDGTKTRVLEITITPQKDGRDSHRPIFLREMTSHYNIRRELEKELERYRLLNMETHHRVKNSLAIVSSLINLKANDLKESGELLDLIGQVKAVAAVHHELSQKPDTLRIDACSYLSTLIYNALHAYGFQQTRPEINIENCELPAKTATSLGIMVNEIITNSCKYGFSPANRSEARIWLELRSLNQEVGTELILRIGNNGEFQKERPALGNSSGTGRSLIDSLLQEMNASLTVTKKPHPIFEIRLTLRDK